MKGRKASIGVSNRESPGRSRSKVDASGARTICGGGDHEVIYPRYPLYLLYPDDHLHPTDEQRSKERSSALLKVEALGARPICGKMYVWFCSSIIVV